jgi:hypothetical protein
VSERQQPPDAGPRERYERAERRYLRGPQSALFETVHALRIFREYGHGLRALRRVGPCVTVFGSARLHMVDTPGDAVDVVRLETARFGLRDGRLPG